jgi:aminoglycoside 6'-N-acetyltransferase
MSASVIWSPIVIAHERGSLTVRPAELSDAPAFEAWDHDPDVIAATSDDPHASQAFAGIDWPAEIATRSDVSCHYIAELDGRPIGGMQVIDPHEEPTQYWGDIEPNLRAVDIWLGNANDRGKGYGSAMMRGVIEACFSAAEVRAIVIDPLASNIRAHRFYQRLGFKPVGRCRFGDDDCLVHRLDRADWRAVTNSLD